MTPPTSSRARELRREDFAECSRVNTRWADNDQFGHLNNAVYYELFDSVLNAWLTRETGIDERYAAELGVVAESSCRFFSEVSYPSDVDVTVRTERVGRTSLVFELGLFVAGVDQIAAHGRWAQVYIDRETHQATPIPDAVRQLAERSWASARP